jgi:hypothetical protein
MLECVRWVRRCRRVLLVLGWKTALRYERVSALRVAPLEHAQCRQVSASGGMLISFYFRASLEDLKLLDCGSDLSVFLIFKSHSSTLSGSSRPLFPLCCCTLPSPLPLCSRPSSSPLSNLSTTPYLPIVSITRSSTSGGSLLSAD